MEGSQGQSVLQCHRFMAIDNRAQVQESYICGVSPTNVLQTQCV